MAKIDTLKDNFNDNSFDTTKWVVSNETAATLYERNGRLEFDYTTANPSMVSVLSVSSYDLAGSQVLLNVQQVGVGDSAAQTSLNLYNSVTYGGLNFDCFQYSGELEASYNNADFDFFTVAVVAYDAAIHKWWRIRESGGTIYFDTSPNGIKWNNLGSVTKTTVETAIGGNISSLGVTVYGSIASLSGSPTDAIIDNFNCPPRLLGLTGAGV